MQIVAISLAQTWKVRELFQVSCTVISTKSHSSEGDTVALNYSKNPFSLTLLCFAFAMNFKSIRKSVSFIQDESSGRWR